MRLVEIMTFSEPARANVLDLLARKELDYVVSDHTTGSDPTATVSLPLPAHAVEPIQHELSDLDVDDDLYTVVVDPEAVVSERFGGSSGLYSRVEGLGHQGISRSELRSQAADLIPDLVIYVLMTAISALVATAGVLLASPAVLVGSMVIAPLIGPPMATSVATVIDDRSLFRRSLKFQAYGTAVAVGCSIAFALLLRATNLVPAALDIGALLAVANHTSPTVLLIVVALSAGVAGAVSLSTNATTGLVGVMIAAAVIPPLGVMGVGIAWLRPVAVLGAGAVVLLNVLSIDLAAIVSLWYLGYHPESWSELRKVRSTMLRRVVVLAASIVVLAALLAHLANGGVAAFAGVIA